MAYVSQELKASIAPQVKAICKRYGVSASLAVKRHSTLTLNVKSGPIDFIGNFNTVANKNNTSTTRNPSKGSIQVNTYWYHEHFTGDAAAFLKEVITAMNKGNHDNSDIITDYFDVGWYVDVNIGQWDKPYTLIVE